MKLKLLIKGHCIDEIDLPDHVFQFDKSLGDSYELQFESHCEQREVYIKYQAKSLKIRNQRFIEGKDWEIVLITESKLTEELSLLNQEESKLKIA